MSSTQSYQSVLREQIQEALAASPGAREIIVRAWEQERRRLVNELVKRAGLTEKDAHEMIHGVIYGSAA